MPQKLAKPEKGRIIFLHGLTQSASVFYAKTLALRKKLAALGYSSVYLNGPFKLMPAQLPFSDWASRFGAVEAQDDEEANYRGWWTKDGKEKYEIETAIAAVKDYIDNGTIVEGSAEDARVALPDTGNSLPIVGVIGFSQGAALASALVDLCEELLGVQLKFAVLYSGFKIDTKALPQYADKYTADGGKSTDAKLLHVIGELDTVVGEDRAFSFYDITKLNSELLKHPGGHFVPNSKLMVERVTNWIQSVDADADEKPVEQPEDTVDDLLAMIDKLGG